VAEGIGLSTMPQRAIAEFYSERGRLPSSNMSVGVAQPTSITGSYVVRVEVTNSGEIAVEYGNQANVAIAGVANQCLFTPVTSARGVIRWEGTCGFSNRYLPEAFR